MIDETEERLKQAMALLEVAGAAEAGQPSGTLMQHLRGTYDLLTAWTCPMHVRLAGLCHSVYGTEVFTKETIPLHAREHLKEAIGEQAEELAFLYCAIQRPSLYENLERTAPYAVADRWGGTITLRGLEQLSDLLTLDVANRLDQLQRTATAATFRATARDIYERAAPLLPAPAVEALRAALPRMSKLEFMARARVWRLRRQLRRLRDALLPRS